MLSGERIGIGVVGVVGVDMGSLGGGMVLGSGTVARYPVMDRMDWVISANRVSRHQNLSIRHLDTRLTNHRAHLNHASQSATSCHFHLITSKTCKTVLVILPSLRPIYSSE